MIAFVGLMLIFIGTGGLFLAGAFWMRKIEDRVERLERIAQLTGRVRPVLRGASEKPAPEMPPDWFNDE